MLIQSARPYSLSAFAFMLRVLPGQAENADFFGRWLVRTRWLKSGLGQTSALNVTCYGYQIQLAPFGRTTIRGK